MSESTVKSYLREAGWEIVHQTVIPERPATFVGFNDLALSNHSQEYLSKLRGGLYRHQHEAIRIACTGKNVCITTGTASGKSLVFYVAAIEELVRDPKSRIAAVYPLKALGSEQQERWQKALKEAGLIDCKVGRIDGSVPTTERMQILRESRVVVMTPDIIHAWLLTNVNSKIVAGFLRHLRIVALDEAHVYTGVFGSNSAFLFRRLNHVANILWKTPRYIAASATIKNPAHHMSRLVGLPFDIVGTEYETSPKKALEILMLNPPEEKDLLSCTSELMEFIANNTDHRFIAFVDSRKQAEYITAIAARQPEPDGGSGNFDYDYLERLKILPYRAGYEENDRRKIQERLADERLKGVVSTSALEMGIDIPSLTLGILLGVPGSSTSFYQRIGRVGRQKEGLILIVNDGSIFTNSIFREPERLLNMPLTESALYLENPRIQYIHAMCLARQGGEHDSALSHFGEPSDKFETEIDFPEDFLSLCQSERIGELSREYQAMKSEAGEDPNHAFPLRDIEVQYKVEYVYKGEQRDLGSLSHSQLMREAYPGAVYYYQTTPYRVYRVHTREKVVMVKPERRYTTKPIFLPTLIFPNLSADDLFRCVRFGDMFIAESSLQIRETISGYQERQGRKEVSVSYPPDPSTTGVYFDLPRFTRNYFTTGVILSHPAFNEDYVKCSVVSQVIYEAFMMTVPFERQDINFGDDKFRANRGEFKQGQRFVSVFDNTYGSLRLTGRLMQPDVLLQTLNRAVEIAKHDGSIEVNQETIKVIEALRNCLQCSAEELVAAADELSTSGEWEMVIAPGSKGLDITRNNEEFFVEKVFFSPRFNCLVYRGRHLSEQSADKGLEISVPTKNIVEIPGESKMSLYNYETGEFKDI